MCCRSTCPRWGSFSLYTRWTLSLETGQHCWSARHVSCKWRAVWWPSWYLGQAFTTRHCTMYAYHQCYLALLLFSPFPLSFCSACLDSQAQMWSRIIHMIIPNTVALLKGPSLHLTFTLVSFPLAHLLHTIRSSSGSTLRRT